MVEVRVSGGQMFATRGVRILVPGLEGRTNWGFWRAGREVRQICPEANTLDVLLCMLVSAHIRACRRVENG